MSSGWAVVGLGFLGGSIPFGYILVRLAGRGDIRRVGSGNIGATNVGRVLGPAGWVFTVLADAGKGAVPVLVAPLLAPDAAWAAAAAGVAAIVGHCYTPWLGGRGGKGVATMLGAFLVLSPRAVVVVVICFVAVAALTRYASAASLTAVAGLLVASWALGEPAATVAAAAATAVLVGVRHRANIVRLVQGTESRMGATGR